MRSVNEKAVVISLRQFMDDDFGWGRAAGRVVYPRLLDFVEQNPGVSTFRVSLAKVRRIDISFASETLVELARRYRGAKGFCFIDLADPDLLENIDAAALRKAQPLIAWSGAESKVLGPEPSEGTKSAFAFALSRPFVRAAEFAQAVPGLSMANVSTKFKQLWEQGFLLRRETTADSGGMEFIYFAVK
jgi:hypothetical protein